MTSGPESSVSVVVLAKEVREAKSIGTVLVVTSDPTIRRDAGGMGAEVVWEGRPMGMNRAAALGRERALRMRPLSPVAILVADLPRLRAHELDLAVDEFRQRRAAMFVADHTGEGTTLLIHGADSQSGIAFGRSSAVMHSRLGYEPSQGKLSGLRADLDTPRISSRWWAAEPRDWWRRTQRSLNTSSGTATASLCRALLERDEPQPPRRGVSKREAL